MRKLLGRRSTWLTSVASIFAAGVVCITTCREITAATKAFERLDVFPEGKQGSGLRALAKVSDTNTVTVTLNAPAAAVWVAVKKTAQNFDRVGKRPVVGINDNGYRIQNGQIQLESLKLSGSLNDWRDEVVTKLQLLTPKRHGSLLHASLWRRGSAVASGAIAQAMAKLSDGL
jgi:hypothetical protein